MHTPSVNLPREAADARVSVALVEDDDASRQRLERAIRSDASLSLVMVARNGGELLAWFEDHIVDVLLVDLGLPDIRGPELIRRCCAMQPSCAVMVITMFGDEGSMLQAFEAGARGYLLKDGTESDLAGHVHQLHAGGSPMTPIIARRLLAHWQAGTGHTPAAPPPAEPALGMISRREREVLDLVARGFTYLEIANQMNVSVSTVQTHVRNMYAKLGVHNRTEAVFEARQHGILR